MRKLKLIIAASLLTLAACKSDGEKTESEPPTATATQTAAQTAAQPESAPTVGEPAQDATFFAPAAKADKLVVTATSSGGSPGESFEVVDAEWLKKFHEAIGDGPGSEAVPKCLPSYHLTYFTGEAETAKYSAVCANAENAVFVKGGQSFDAKNDAEVIGMLESLAKGE